MNKTLLISSYRGPLLSRLVETAWDSGWSIAVTREQMTDREKAVIRPALGKTVMEATSKGIAVMEHMHPSPGKTEPPDHWMARHARPAGQPPYPWREDECALVLFTSGSTGSPKGVCHSLGNIRRSAQLFVDHFELTEQDRLLCLAPVHTMSGFRSLVLPGVKVEHVHEETSFLSLVQHIDRIRAPVVLCGPVFIRQLAAWADRLGPLPNRLRGLLCTGADLHPEDRKQVEQTMGIPVLDYYGLTETAGLVLGDTFSRRSPGCLPQPCRGVQLMLQPANREHDTFELAISSPNLFLGYLGDPLARRRIFNTGDLVQSRGKRCLKLLGRRSGAVKAPSTEWVYPRRLENWLRENVEQISDVVARAVPIPGGYGLELWIDSREDFDTVSLENRIVARLGKDYRPVQWHFAPIERTPLGKLPAPRQGH